MSEKKNKGVITARDIAAYVVCPEAWRIKLESQTARRETSRTREGQRRRSEWAKSQDLSFQLRNYAKILYLLLVALVIVVFLMEHQRISTDASAPDRSNSSQSNSGELR